MTRSEAEEIFTTCVALSNVLGKDVQELCRSRGMPEELIQEFVARQSGDELYDQFFELHDAGGGLELNEREIVLKLRNFGIKAGVDKEGQRWIAVPGTEKNLNSVQLRLCRELTSRYGYRYR